MQARLRPVSSNLNRGRHPAQRVRSPARSGRAANNSVGSRAANQLQGPRVTTRDPPPPPCGGRSQASARRAGRGQPPFARSRWKCGAGGRVRGLAAGRTEGRLASLAARIPGVPAEPFFAGDVARAGARRAPTRRRRVGCRAPRGSRVRRVQPAREERPDERVRSDPPRPHLDFAHYAAKQRASAIRMRRLGGILCRSGCGGECR